MLGYGNVTIPQEVLSLGLNPAAPAAIVGDGGFSYQEAISVNPSFSIEIGDIGQAQDEYDALSGYDFANPAAGTITSMVTDSNAFFSALSDAFYVKTSVGTNIPFLPLVTGSRSFGSLYLSADVTAQTSARFLDTPVQVNGTNISASGAIYAKAAYRGDLSLGYSRYMMDTTWGELYIGGKLNTYYVGTNKTLSSASFDLATDTVTTSSPSTINFTKNNTTDMDLGIMLKGSRYQAGMSITNLGSPSFAYPAIGQNCASLTDPAAQQNCYIAVAHSGEISLNEVHVMSPQIHLEGGLLGANGNFIISTALDLNAVNDLLGDPVQYFTISSAYAVQGWLGVVVPRFRMGFRKNLAGTGLTEMNMGLSLFRILSLDVAEAMNSTTINGTTVPRSLRVNLGLGINF